MLSFRAVTVYQKIDAMLNFSELDDYGHFAKQTIFANLCCNHVVRNGDTILINF